jgi:hypothetical protein
MGLLRVGVASSWVGDGRYALLPSGDRVLAHHAKDAAAAEVLSIWRRSIMAWFSIFPGALPWRRRSSQDIEARTDRAAIKRFVCARSSAAFLRDQPFGDRLPRLGAGSASKARNGSPSSNFILG